MSNEKTKVKSGKEGNVDKEEDVILATVKPPAGGIKQFYYSPATPIDLVVTDSTGASGYHLETAYVEMTVESIERGKLLRGRGGKFGFNLPNWLGGGGIEIEVKPKKEIKNIKTAKWRKPQKR